MSPETPREKIPFEPPLKKKKNPKKPSVTVTNSEEWSKDKASLSAIPESVSRRMIKRMAILSGIPTVLGITSFLGFYWVVTHDIYEVPTIAVVLITMALFGSGVLGLTYGILSSSWDEHDEGSVIGWQEFKVNFGRMTTAWKSARKDVKIVK